jgi:ubiquinone/menaquinone biosynthesis C-methylase UbiE
MQRVMKPNKAYECLEQTKPKFTKTTSKLRKWDFKNYTIFLLANKHAMDRSNYLKLAKKFRSFRSRMHFNALPLDLCQRRRLKKKWIELGIIENFVIDTNTDPSLYSYDD